VPHWCITANFGSECPLWVKADISACPLYPQKRTLVERLGMSALGQKQSAASGHATDELAIPVMKSRRLNAPPQTLFE